MKLLRVLCVVALALFSAVTFAQMIDINTATAEQLDKGLKGIGPKKGADIVKYREANGAFKSVDDLANVPGIKEKTLEKIRPMVSVGETAAPAMTAPSVPAKPAAPTMPAMPAKPAMPVAPAIPPKPVVTPVPAAPTPPVMPPKQ
jgi:competence protein ComEA